MEFDIVGIPHARARRRLVFDDARRYDQDASDPRYLGSGHVERRDQEIDGRGDHLLEGARPSSVIATPWTMDHTPQHCAVAVASGIPTRIYERDLPLVSC